MSLIEKHYPVTVLNNTAHIVGNHKDRGSLLSDFFHSPVTLGLEKYISHRQSLIYDQDFRFYINCQRKSQPHKHTAGIGFYRLIYKITDIGKFQNLRQLFIHLAAGKSHHRTVHIYIFNSGIVHIESGTQLQKCGNHSAYPNISRCRSQHSGNNLQDCRFSGSIGSDNAHGFSLFHLKRDVAEGKKIPVIAFMCQTQGFLQAINRLFIQPVYLAYILYLDGVFTVFSHDFSFLIGTLHQIHPDSIPSFSPWCKE